MTGELVENVVVDGYGSNSSAVGFRRASLRAAGARVRAATLGAALLLATVGGHALGASQLTSPQPTPAQALASQPTSPQPTPAQAVASKPASPQPITAQAVASQPASPQPVTALAVPPQLTPPAKTNSSPPGNSALAALGKQIFSDPSLSESGRMSCATCHSPQHAYGPPNGLAVQRGGAALDRQGARAVPSLRYVLNRTPIWSQPFVANRAERIIEGEEPPRGGFGWDGRFNTLHEQAVFPLLSPNEMANGSPGAVMAHLRRASYVEDVRNVFGPRVFDDANAAYKGALLALERFELDDPSFHPYTSKFDDYLEGKVELTAQELHGKTLFDDPQRGNCAVCHLDRKGVDGSHPLFTDYQFEALGVPRNTEILANGNSSYFDEGVCGPLRGDLVAESRYCGLFKTPTLRNVATRAVFFHNGVFHTLRDALRFYVRRDTDPNLWYPSAAAIGAPNKFDDLPSIYRGNVDVIDRPLTLHEGEAPVWSDAEIEDVIAFLRTLTDRDAQSVGVDPP